MTIGSPAIVAVGAGTLTTSAVATTNIAVTPNGNANAGFLTVCVVYLTGGDLNTQPPVDAGDGWIFPDWGYDSANGYGIILAVCTRNRAGTGAPAWSGITVPSVTGYAAQTYTYYFTGGFGFDLGAAVGSRNWFNATASATTLTQPAIAQPYAQCLDLCAGGYNNAAVTTTVGNVTGFTERFDTGATSPPLGVVLRDRIVLNHNINAAANATLAVAKTNRAGARAMIPIIAHTAPSRAHRGQMRRVA